MKREGITVVTPSLNQRSYIYECLESVRRQGGDLIEHLIIDGGSTDGTREVVESFDHATFVDQPKSSQSEALNWGFENANYPTICWLNSDDILLEGAFETVIRQMAGLPERWYLFSSFVEIDSLGSVQGVRIVPGYLEHAVRNFATYVPTSGSFFSQTIVSDEIRLDGDLHYLMDRDFIVRLSSQGYKVARSSKLLAAFRIHDEQKSGQGKNETPRILERAKVSERHGGLWHGKTKFTGHNKLLENLFKVYVGASWKASALANKFPKWTTLDKERTNAQRWIDSLKE